MNTSPPISVLTTVYNNAGYVEASVRSILGQTFKDFEYVIVDDGSTDGSVDILKRLAEEDDRIRLQCHDHLGISKAAKHGLAACRGKWVARLDGDDLAWPDRLEKQLAFVEANDLVCASGQVDFIDQKDRFLITIPSPCDHEGIEEKMLRGHNTIWHSGCMFRRNAAEQIGGYSEDFDAAIDLDLCLRLGEIGRLGNSMDRVIQYRLHRKSVSAKRRQYQRDMAKVACDRAAQRRGIEPCFDAEEMWRPGSDRSSRHDFALRFGWWAFNSGEKKTARAYGYAAVATLPWRIDGWRLLVCSIFKNAPQPQTQHHTPHDFAHPA